MLKAEAYSFLTGITISFENDFHQAFFYSKALHDLYPQNPFYYAVYIKNLLLIKRYDEAEMHIRFNRAKTNNNFFKAQLLIFQGIVYEKKYRDPKQAQAHYSKGIKEISPFGVYGNEFKAYGYYGLSRISEATKDNQKRKFYRKQADDFAVFENVNFDN
jgi:tetratricopeptide (TPR) repeat protein